MYLYGTITACVVFEVISVTFLETVKIILLLCIRNLKMARAGREKIKLESTAGTGYFYITTKPTRSQDKIERKKYDPKVRKHVLFVEKRIR